MKVRDEDVGGNWPVAEFSLQLLAEHAESGAAVEDVDAVAEAHFDAGGVASIAHVLGLWGRRRTAYAPELNPHRLVDPHEGPGAWFLPWYLPTMSGASQLPDWFMFTISPPIQGTSKQIPQPTPSEPAPRHVRPES